MTTAAEAHTQFLEIGAQLSDEEFAEAVAQAASARFGDRTRCIAALLEALHDGRSAAEAEVLDAAALVAARHRALVDRESYLRSLLAFVALQSDLAQQLSGQPRVVLDGIQLALMKRTKVEGDAMRTIWEAPMLRSGEAAAALGAASANRERIRQLRLRSELVGLPHGRGYVFPAFQFDVTRRRLHDSVVAVNKLLDAADDPWGVSSWWLSTNGRLGCRPADLVGTERDGDLVVVAESLLEPVG